MFNFVIRWRILRLEEKLAAIESRYNRILNLPGATTVLTTDVMRKAGPIIAGLKHDITSLKAKLK